MAEEVILQSEDLVDTEGGTAPLYLAHRREYWSVEQASSQEVVSEWNALVKQGGGTAVAAVLAADDELDA